MAPRSTEIQPGSTQPLVELVAQRLAGSLSKALSGVHGLQFTSFCEVLACAGLLYDSSRVAAGSAAARRRWRCGGGELGGGVDGGVVPPEKTWNSQKRVAVDRQGPRVRLIRTYRAVPETGMLCWPPVPVVVAYAWV